MDPRGAGAVYQCSAEKWYYSNNILEDNGEFLKDCNLMTMFVVLNAFSSVIFGVLTSTIRFKTHSESHQSFTVYLTNNSIGSFLCEAACKKKFRMCSNETHSGHNALSQD